MTEQSILAAISGIQANQTYLDSIGNNIANVDTVGYKSGQVQFADLLSQQIGSGKAPQTGSGGIDPTEIGSGVTVSANQLNLSEGGIESTGVNSDVAIKGGGYLVVENGGQQLYTRNGALNTDANGDLTTLAGGLVLGWAANSSGTVNTATPLAPIKIPTNATVGAQATTELTLGGNLPAWNGSGTPPQAVTTTYKAYDALGDVVPVTVTFTPVAKAYGSSSDTANNWIVNATVQDPNGTVEDVLGKPGTPANGSNPATAPTGVTVQFDPTSGEISAMTGTGYTQNPDGSYSLSLSLPTAYSWPSGEKNLSLNFPAPGTNGNVTQFSAAQSLQIETGDGSPAGTLQSYTIGGDGTVTGTFSNGDTQVLGQIALAGFANPAGLVEEGNGLFATSSNSGQPLVGAPGTGSLGTLAGGELEQSNVDLATELTNLITAQQAYTANTKVLTTTASALQALEQVP